MHKQEGLSETRFMVDHMDTTMQVFLFIREYLAMHLWPPTLKEIAAGCGLVWPSSVIRHLDRLEGWGLITRAPGRARSIALTDKGQTFSPGSPAVCPAPLRPHPRKKRPTGTDSPGNNSPVR